MDVLQSDTGSVGSGHSLRSRGSLDVEPSEPSQGPISSRWQEFEEVVLLEYLSENLSTSGDGLNFPKGTWKPASEYVNSCTLPPGKKRTIKTPASCKNKWNALKAGYHHVVHIKNASGLTWSDTDGVGVSSETQHVWDEIVKVRPAAKPYGNKGFPHFAVIDHMKTHGKGGKNKSKGAFVHRRKNAPASSGAMLPPPTPSSSRSMLPASGNALDLSSLATATNDIISPASFITSTSPSALTSASRGKRKYSALGADSGGDGSKKKQRTPSASVQAQQEGSAAMTMLAGIVGDLSRTFAETANAPPPLSHLPNQQAPIPHLAQAIDIVRQTPDLTPDDILDMVDFFLKPGNESSAVGYITLADPDLRAKWVERRLRELRRS